uniref:60S acidic ribosomal protein P2 n=2 Tax=Hemiselmis andersenii TaxID=464988 RepID=A0A6U4JFP4_HEMAN|mmetsp:Transcript_5391/g.12451  ORF Transcript_5391/g.12451 Transcript_5391/m.12451 type:complete len:192 (+) Transcript_5391:224-799(+)
MVSGVHRGAIAMVLCSALCGAMSTSAPVRGWGAHAVGGMGGLQRQEGPAGMGGATMRLRGGTANLAAYVLLRMGGKQSPTTEDVTKVLESVGAKVETELIEKVVTEMDGKDINELIEKGKEQVAEIDMLAAGGAAVGNGGGSTGGGDGDDKKRSGSAKKGGDAKQEENDEASSMDMGGGSGDDDMGFGLFD